MATCLIMDLESKLREIKHGISTPKPEEQWIPDHAIETLELSASTIEVAGTLAQSLRAAVDAGATLPEDVLADLDHLEFEIENGDDASDEDDTDND